MTMIVAIVQPQQLHSGRAQRSREGGPVGALAGYRRRGVLRPRAGVLPVRRRALRSEHAARLLLREQRKCLLEHGRAKGEQLGPSCRTQGRLFRLASGRPVSQPALEDDDDPAQRRGACGASPPRGSCLGPERDRHALCAADASRRQRRDIQVRREERRPPPRQGRDLHAQAAVRGERLRHARSPQPLEGRHQPLLRPLRLC